MKKVALVTAAVMAVSGGVLFASPARGAPIANTIAASQIQRDIAATTVDAVWGPNIDALAEHMAPARAEFLLKSPASQRDYNKRLSGYVHDISSRWQSKYGHPLSIQRASEALTAHFASFNAGSAGFDKELTSQVERAANTSVQRGRAIAMAYISSPANLPNVQAAFVCGSGNHWELQPPSSLSAAHLRNNLSIELGAFDAESARWPASESAAYRRLAHRVMLAVMDYPAATAALHSPNLTPLAMQPASAKVAAAEPTTRPAPQSTPAQATASKPSWWQFWRW